MSKRKRIPVATTLFPAYEQEEAPSIPGFNKDGFQSSATYDSFARTAEQKRKEDEKRKQAERLKRKKEAEQDKSHYSVKTIGMYSSSEDDDDCIVISHNVKENTERIRSPSLERIDYDGATTSRVRKESPKRSRDDRKKKHKKRHRHSSTSSNDGSYRKKKKKRHRRDSSSESGELSESSIKSPVKKVETWSLMDLEKFRSANIASLIVSDVRADYKNAEFESIYHLFVPRYRPYIRALIGAPERLNHKLFNYRGLPEKNQITRYFDKSILKNWGKRPTERRFRTKAPINSDFVPLSHVAYNSENDEGPIKKEELNNMNIDDFELLKAAQSDSFEDFNFPPEKKAQILNSRLRQNPQDIEGWLMFIKLQDELIADMEFAVRDNIVKTRASAEKKLEILKTALQKNAASVELRLEKVKVMEQLYGPTDIQVEKEWKQLENRHLNSIKMWKGNIQMHKNDRALFKLDYMLALVARCIDRIQNLVSGNIRSHQKEQGSEEFLVELIVLYCKLLLETGNLPKVVAILQAITEFYIFIPELDLKNFNPKNLFEKFWNSGVPRVGDEDAKGWKNSKMIRISSKEYEEEKLKEFDGDYNGYLGAQLKELEENEKTLLEKCQENGLSHPQVWSLVEKCRDEFTWRPLRFIQEKLLNEYCWSKFEYMKDIEPILVTFPDAKYSEKLICSLLKLLGCVIPGEVDLSQEAILSAFGILPNFARNYNGLYEFFDRFLQMLSQVESATREFRAKFAVARLQTFQQQIKLENLEPSDRKKRVLNFVKVLIASFPDNEIIINLISCYGAEALEPFDSASALKTYRKLLSVVKRDIWQIPEEMIRIAYLRITVAMCRCLPYYHMRRTQDELTKRSFLNILGALGYFKEMKGEELNNDDIKARWIDRIKKLKEATPNPNLAWLGDEFALTLELASLFVYESAPFSMKLTEFEGFLKSIADSGLSNSAIMEFRIMVNFEHVNHFKNADFRAYRDIVNEAIEKFPTNVSFLKAYIDSNKYQAARIFLRKECQDEATKLVRHCGLFYLEKRAHEILAMESSPNNIDHIRHALEFIAPENCCSCFPDSTLWRVLLDFEKQHGTSKQIDNAFLLAFKQCPWSKNLLLDVAEKKLNVDAFLTDISNYATSSGFRILCYTDEVDLLLMPNA